MNSKLEQCARAIIIQQGHLLVVRVSGASEIFFLPGGHIEDGEDLLSAVSRELSEELPGLQFVIGERLGTLRQQFNDETGAHAVENHYFIVNLTEKFILPHLPQPDAPKFENIWIPLAQVSQINLRPAAVLDLIQVVIERCGH